MDSGKLDLWSAIDRLGIHGGLDLTGRIGQRTSVFAEGWISRPWDTGQIAGGFLGGLRYRW